MRIKEESFWKFVIACLRTDNKELAKKVIKQRCCEVLADSLKKDGYFSVESGPKETDIDKLFKA